MLDVSMGFINKTRKIFNNAKDKVVSNYDSAAWHANNWGLGFIPFYGMTFNIAFSNHIKDTVDAMQTYVITFDKKDPTAPGWVTIQDMKNNLNGLRDSILEIDPTENDLIRNLLEDAGLISTVAYSISEGISVLIDIGASAFPGLELVINAILDLKKLNNQYEHLTNNNTQIEIGTFFNFYNLLRMNNGEYKNQQSIGNKPTSDILEAVCDVIF